MKIKRKHIIAALIAWLLIFVGGFVITEKAIYGRPELQLIKEYLSNCSDISELADKQWIVAKDNARISRTGLNGDPTGWAQGTYHFHSEPKDSKIKIDWTNRNGQVTMSIYRQVRSGKSIPLVIDKIIQES